MKIIFIILSAVVLSSCAFSPQQIVVAPTIDVEAVSYGAGRSIAVAAKNNKAGQVLGSRGGVYQDTSVITVANDLAEVLEELSRQQLIKDGFNVKGFSTLGMDKVPSLQLTVEDIRYELSEDISPKKLSLTTVISAEAYNGRETYTRRYETSKNYTLLVTPSMKKNTEAVNSAFSETLARIFTDPQLKAFLSSI